jgi:hypothetical protein
MNATTNCLDKQNTPGFSEVTGNEMQQVEGGNLAEMVKTIPPAVTFKDLLKAVICGGPNEAL